MQSLGKSHIIEQVFQGLERIAGTYEYAAQMQGAQFPSNIEEFCSGLTESADQIRQECDKLIRAIGGITTNYLARPDSKLPVVIIGISKYEEGNWHLPYREGFQIAEAPLEKPLQWIREAYHPQPPYITQMNSNRVPG